MDKIDMRTFFKVEDGVISQFAFFEENVDSTANENHLNNTLKFSIAKERRLVKVAAGVTLDQGKGPVVRCELELKFKLREDSFDSLIKDNKIIIPTELLVYFGSKAVGALRGVLLAKLENTPINIILPLVNLEEMIEEPFVVELCE